MITNRSWTSYPVTYRVRELKTIAGWVSSGESGSVVGLPGCGRANLLGFLCSRPEIFQSYLRPNTGPVVLIPVDLNNLPANNLATLYRVILRAFYRVRDRLDPTLQQDLASLYRDTQSERDPFLAQSALQELFLGFQNYQHQIVLVLNRFDRFCDIATPQMVNTLRGLRDDFKDTLCYIVGISQEVAYLPDRAALGHMYELLDNYVCWIGAMAEDDARNLIARATYGQPATPTETDIATMLDLTGGYPFLLRATCHWWLTTESKPAEAGWAEVLLAERSIQHRLDKIWNGLTQEEQFILSELQRLQSAAKGVGGQNNGATRGKPKQESKAVKRLNEQHRHTLMGLVEKGVCGRTETGWQIAGDLTATYIATVEGRGRGRIWQDEQTDEVFQGETLLKNLTALERSVLSFFIKQPRLKHTKTDLIVSTWPDELRRQGVSDNSLYQVILTLRKEIEPNPGRPLYLITWRGKPEGGYQFFPEGRPG